eukprot:XP_011452415.2 PREDICTED: uncharacterized protein LOC105345807 isoform X1 [Crassostrea gigas]
MTDVLRTRCLVTEERKTETKVNPGKMDDIVKSIMSMPISPVELLKVFTCMLAGIYTGCSVYAAVIEAPSRSNLPLHSLWEQWSTSLTRAAKVIPVMLLCMAASSGGVFYLSPASDELRNLWLAPMAASLFSFVYTLVVMRPETNILLEKDVITKKGNQWVREAVERWISRHYIRVVLGWVAFVLVLFATVKS